jgi:hypothetical protein
MKEKHLSENASWFLLIITVGLFPIIILALPFILAGLVIYKIMEGIWEYTNEADRHANPRHIRPVRRPRL